MGKAKNDDFEMISTEMGKLVEDPAEIRDEFEI